MASIPEHLLGREGRGELIREVGGVGGGRSRVVGDGDDEELGEDGQGLRQQGGLVAHDGGEVAAGGRAADGDLGGVELQRGDGGGHGGPEKGLPRVVYRGGVWSFGGESARRLV